MVYYEFVITTQSQHYHYPSEPSPKALEGRSFDLSDTKPLETPDEVFQPSMTWEIATQFHVL